MKNRQIGAKFIQNARKSLVDKEVILTSHHRTESALKRLKSGAVKRIK